MTTSRSPHRLLRPRRLAAVGLVAALSVSALATGSAGVGAQTPELDAARADRRAVQDRQDRLAEDLDVLTASRGEIEDALDELDDAVAAQQAVVEAAAVRAAEAAAELGAAQVAVLAAERDVRSLRAAIREMAIAAFIHPPTADLVQSLKAASLSDALLQKAYLDARAARDVDLLGLLELAEDLAVRVEQDREAAATEADAAASVAAEALGALEQERLVRERFAVDLRDRIDAALAEAAVLADQDADLAADIVRQQSELLARVPPPPPPPTSEAASPATGPATPTTTTPTAGGSGPGSDRTISVPPLATVEGITVHAELAADLAALLAAAAADGVELGGSGYRSTQRQIELRIAHCGPTDHDIWEKPAGACTPPTAIPGRSLHEQGRAIDFTHQGMLITSRANAGFVWLAANAASFGLFNLPSEPWHWSTTGY